MIKIFSALKEDFKATNWMIEFRYFITVAVVPSIVSITILVIINDDDPFMMGSVLGWLMWLLYTSYGTTHESRKKNIRNIFWCIDPYVYPCLPSLTRQSLLIKHNLNHKEFTVFSLIQRLHLIFGVLLMFVLVDMALVKQYPHLDENQFIGLYFFGGIVALAFFAAGYFDDMKTHYIKVAQEAKKFLWKYTFLVFIYSSIAITVLYFSVFSVIRLVLHPT